MWNTGHWESSSGWQHSPQGEGGQRPAQDKDGSPPTSKQKGLGASPGTAPTVAWSGSGAPGSLLKSSQHILALVWTGGSAAIVANHKN